MYSLGLLAASSFLLALVLTPVARELARRFGWVDEPDRRRRLHAQPVPRLGGAPIFASYLAALALLLVSPLAGAEIVRGGLPLAGRILPAAALVFAIGLVDDLRGVRPWQKFAVQLAAAAVAFGAGVQITSLAGWMVPAWLSLPVTLLWLAGCSNAFNLIDGVDGLAAGAGLFATVTILVGALLQGNVPLALATVPLAGALLGFLRYNFNPASIFLGDSGSLTVGFLLGCYGVLWGQKSATVLGMTAPLMALAVPLVDTAVAIGRRFLRGQPIYVADRGHIHHRLLDRGLTPRRVALLLYAACGLAAGLSLVASVSEGEFKGLIIVLFCAMAWMGVQHLGYVEFGVAGRMFLEGAFRRHLKSQLALEAFARELAAAETPGECWRAVCEAASQFGFAEVEMRLHGDQFRAALEETNGNPTWRVEIPLEEGGWLTLRRCFDAPGAPTVLVPFADTLRRGIERFQRRHEPAVRAG
jgi:UDP-GlcNAc:undecaprenyl-phosphate GlcNAc-1-phosphate transferase